MFSEDQILAASDFANLEIIDYIFWWTSFQLPFPQSHQSCYKITLGQN